jgi:hypothetical protein
MNASDELNRSGIALTWLKSLQFAIRSMAKIIMAHRAGICEVEDYGLTGV